MLWWYIVMIIDHFDILIYVIFTNYYQPNIKDKQLHNILILHIFHRLTAADR